MRNKEERQAAPGGLVVRRRPVGPWETPPAFLVVVRSMTTSGRSFLWPQQSCKKATICATL